MCKFATSVLSLMVLLGFGAIDAKALTVYDLATSIIASSYSYFRDDDGDGIPNCDDPDYVPPEDGDGNRWKGGR